MIVLQGDRLKKYIDGADIAAYFLLDREFCSEIEHNIGININR